MGSGQEFRAAMGRWANATEAKLDGLARQLCQGTAEYVVEHTPVDTGFLRSSWQPSIGTPQAGDGGGDPGAKISLVIPAMKAGDIFHMSNNANYAEFVEYGTTKMMGRFFVTRGVKRAPELVKRLAVELKL
jgi:hypothetical protein